MGGIGSGRRYSENERRPDVEVCPAVDLRFFKPHLGEELLVTQKIFKNNSLNYKFLIDLSDAKEGFITVYFRHQEKHQTQQISLTEMSLYLGGNRVFMICPECIEQFSVLYLRDGLWACRRCHGLAYKIQRMNPRQRHLHMLRKIGKRKLEGKPPDERPFRMRKKTHQEIVNELATHHKKINKIAKKWQRDIQEKYLSR